LRRGSGRRARARKKGIINKGWDGNSAGIPIDQSAEDEGRGRPWDNGEKYLLKYNGEPTERRRENKRLDIKIRELIQSVR